MVFYSLLADIFMPHLGIIANIIGQDPHALLRAEVYDFDPVSPQPFKPSGKVHRFSHDYRANLKLPNQPAAVPAGSERRHHHLIPVAPLPSRFAESIGFGMNRGIILLNSTIVTGPEKFAAQGEQCGANGNPPL